MNKQQEALKLALEVLECDYVGDKHQRKQGEAITAIREALAQPEQEKDWGAVAEKHLAALKQSSKAITEDAAVRAVHNMAQARGLIDIGRIFTPEKEQSEPPPEFIDALKYDVAKRDFETAQQDYWQEEARRYAKNADFWRSKYEAATAQDNTYNYAKNLAEAIFKQHFASDEHYASGRIVWGVCDTVIGILTQIDNMVADMVRRPAQQQEPVAYDKTEINCFAQDLYDQKMREGKRGHYESMFHVIHQCIKKVSPPASKPWVGLTRPEIAKASADAQVDFCLDKPPTYEVALARAIEAKLRSKNA